MMKNMTHIIHYIYIFKEKKRTSIPTAKLVPAAGLGNAEGLAGRDPLSAEEIRSRSKVIEETNRSDGDGVGVGGGLGGV